MNAAEEKRKRENRENREKRKKKNFRRASLSLLFHTAVAHKDTQNAPPATSSSLSAIAPLTVARQQTLANQSVSQSDKKKSSPLLHLKDNYCNPSKSTTVILIVNYCNPALGCPSHENNVIP